MVESKKVDTSYARHPVLKLPDNYIVFDLTKGYDPQQVKKFIDNGGRAVGGYFEKRVAMYVAPQYKNRRNIHMGIDFWAPAGEPVYAPFAGRVAYKENHTEEGNYGPAIVTVHQVAGKTLFALYGHLSEKSLGISEINRPLKAGDVVGWLGEESENGNWPPHLHYQLSYHDPGTADMPGVVEESDAHEAKKIYPDPRLYLGNLYD